MTLLRDEILEQPDVAARFLERAPEAFIGMLKGHNFGKTLVRVSS